MSLLSTIIAVGGYKAVAGDNGDLKGAVHEVPGLVPAPALHTLEHSNGGSLTVGTSDIITHSLAKRDAEADPLHKEAGHAVHHVAPATHEIDNEVCNYSYQQKIEETTADIPENEISKVISELTRNYPR